MSVWVLSVSALFGLGPVCLDLVCLEPLYISGSGPCLCEPYVYIYIYSGSRLPASVSEADRQRQTANLQLAQDCSPYHSGIVAGP